MNPIRKPYTLSELREMQNEQGVITAVISTPWNKIGDIERLNDIASELITGEPFALEDISYRLVGANVQDQELLFEVSGSVESWLAETVALD